MKKMTMKFNEAYEKNLPDPKKRRTHRDKVLSKTVSIIGPSGKPADMEIKIKPNEVTVDYLNLFGLGLKHLPSELTELKFDGRPIDRIKTLIAGGNPLESLEGLPPVVNTLNIKGHPRGGALQSVAGSPDTKVDKLTLDSTDVTTLEGMPEVQTNLEFRSNNKFQDKEFNGLNVAERLKSLPPEEVLDFLGGGMIETNKHVTKEDFIKALQRLGVDFQATYGK